MNILAYKELVERKEEEINSLHEQLGRMRNSSIYNPQTPHAFRGNSNQGADGHVNYDNMMPAMCGTKDCAIF